MFSPLGLLISTNTDSAHTMYRQRLSQHEFYIQIQILDINRRHHLVY